jgi:hypothetical protein
MKVSVHTERRGWGLGIDYAGRQLHVMLIKVFIVFDFGTPSKKTTTWTTVS